jgi:hypothetical protein
MKKLRKIIPNANIIFYCMVGMYEIYYMMMGRVIILYRGKCSRSAAIKRAIEKAMENKIPD